MSGKAKDLTGMRFGRLTVLERSENRKGCVQWTCECDCGNQKTIRSASILSGRTQSCGCLGRERRLEANTRHGQSNTRLYSIWRNMKCRCSCETASKYEIYGGKGISVCDDWLDFSGFERWALNHGYSDTLSIDRINGQGDYCPENCRWVTYKVQANNTAQNHTIEYAGMKKTLSEWADYTGIPYRTLSTRILRGWAVERAMTTPTQSKKGATPC